MVNYKSLLFTFCGILLSAPWASAYYEEKLSHSQVPAVEILPAVQEPPTTAGNIAERPLPQAAQGQIESSPPPPIWRDWAGGAGLSPGPVPCGKAEKIS